VNRPRLAVIGLNFGRKHVESILSLEAAAELIAVCDIDESHRAHAIDLGVSFYADFQSMVQEKRPDGVVIAVPPSIHEKVGLYCLDRGIHCLIEKPIASSPAAADRLIEKAQAHGAKLLIGHHHRFDPGVEAVRERIRSAEIGALIGFHVFGTYPKIPEYFKEPWRTKRESGGGPLVSNGVHDVDRVRFVCGEIKTVTALMSSAYRGYEVEDTAGVVIECESGVVGTLFISDCSHPTDEVTDYYFCAGGTMTLNCSSFRAAELRHVVSEAALASATKSERLFTTRQRQIPHQDNHLREMQHFCRVIDGAEEPRSTGEDAKRSLIALLSIVESAEKRQTISIRFEP